MTKIDIIKRIIIVGILITVAYFVTEYHIENKDKELKDDFFEKIDKAFEGKDVISDGVNNPVQVQRISIPTISLQGGNIYTEENYKDLVSYYERITGGFTILKAKRTSSSNRSKDGIDVYEIYSTNMGYKVNNISNYWMVDLSFNECYKSAYEYLTVEDISSGFTPGKFQQISDLHKISNEYYRWWETDTSRGLSEKYNSSYVYNNYWKVFYHRIYTHYWLDYAYNYTVKKREFRKIFSISTLGILLLSFVFMYNPKKKTE